MTKKSKNTTETPNIDTSAFKEQDVRDNTLVSSGVMVTRDEFTTQVTYTNKPDTPFSMVEGVIPLPKQTKMSAGKIVETGKTWIHYNYVKDAQGINTDEIKTLVIHSFIPNEWQKQALYLNKKGEKKQLIRFYKHSKYVMGFEQIKAFKDLAQINNELCLFQRSGAQ